MCNEIAFYISFSAEKCAAKDLTSDYDDDLLPPEVDKYKKASQSVKTALRGVEFIAQHIKDADKDNEVKANLSLTHRPFLWNEQKTKIFLTFSSLLLHFIASTKTGN